MSNEVHIDKDMSLSRWGYLVPYCASISFLLACLVDAHVKPLWFDELLTYYLVNDQSIVHMITALSDKVDVSPPLYYAITWLWAKTFGGQELSLRLFSSVCVCTAFFILWKLLRQYYGTWVASIACTASFGLSKMVSYQNSEARCYGLFLLSCSLATVQFDKIIRRDNDTWRLFFLNFCTHAAMVYIHIYGFLYSAAFLLACLMYDFYQQRFRQKFYLSVITAWISYVFWLNPFLSQLDVVRPKNWIPIPQLGDLTEVLASGINLKLLIPNLFLMAVVFWLVSNYVQRASGTSVNANSRGCNNIFGHLELLALSLVIVVPSTAWVASQFTTPIFHQRYFVVGIPGWSIVIASLTCRLVGGCLPVYHWKQGVTVLVFAIFFAFKPLIDALEYSVVYSEPRSVEVSYCPQLPIVVEGYIQFLQRQHYCTNRTRYHFVLDERVCYEREANIAYKTMGAIKRHYLPESIKTYSDFLNQHDAFLVLLDPLNWYTWYEIRLKNDATYSSERLLNNLILVKKNPKKQKST